MSFWLGELSAFEITQSAFTTECTGRVMTTLTTDLVPHRILINILQKHGVPTSSSRNQSPYALDNIIWRFFLKHISKDFRWTKTFPRSLKFKRVSKWDTFGWTHVIVLCLASYKQLAFEDYSADKIHTLFDIFQYLRIFETTTY